MKATKQAEAEIAEEFEAAIEPDPETLRIFDRLNAAPTTTSAGKLRGIRPKSSLGNIPLKA